MREIAAVAAAGALAVLLAAVLDKREVAYPTGVPAVRLAEELAPGATACWGPVRVPEPFARVRLVTATFGAPGPALEVAVRAPDGRLLGRGRVPGGYPDNRPVTARVGPVAARPVGVCVRNRGATRLALFGVPPDARVPRLRDPGLDPVPAAVFLRDEPVSMLSQVPAALARAARFKAGWVGTWTLWLLAAAMTAGLPLLLARALGAAQARERSNAGASSGGSSSPERAS